MPQVYCLYIDDSGTRNPDRNPHGKQFKDWFALGGILVKEEDEPTVEGLHAKFCSTWNIDYPLHSYDIREKTARFSWLGKLNGTEFSKFMSDLSELLTSIPVIGHACVIDRSGYQARYREKYGRQTWMLCQTAFGVICERSAKLAINEKRKLRVYPERGDKSVDRRVQNYYAALRLEGMPFAKATSDKYGPLTANQLKDTLYDLKFKSKTSALAQLADLYLYPIARGGYDATYLPYKMLREKKRLIDDLLPTDELESRGIKYSCFELEQAAKNTKAEEQSSA